MFDELNFFQDYFMPRVTKSKRFSLCFWTLGRHPFGATFWGFPMKAGLVFTKQITVPSSCEIWISKSLFYCFLGKLSFLVLGAVFKFLWSLNFERKYSYPRTLVPACDWLLYAELVSVNLFKKIVCFLFFVVLLLNLLKVGRENGGGGEDEGVADPVVVWQLQPQGNRLS